MYRPLFIQIKVQFKFYRAINSSSGHVQENTIKIDKWNINYIKVGRGNHHVLFIPGALGTIWTNFRAQIEEFDRDKFTLIAWDPPGYGKSRPPDKEFTPDYHQKDADHVFQFMKALQIPKYSLIGWSDGGGVAVLHAAKYPGHMVKLVTIAAGTKVTGNQDAFEQLKNINSWPESLVKPMIEIYGDTFTNYWHRWIDGHFALCEKDNGNICQHVLKDVKCPTFVLYGAKDPVSPQANSIELVKSIAGSRSHVYPDGKHNIHIRFSDDFNKRVQEFLLQP